ncbi:MAG: 3-deoxy-manno-octulosonate cytidylyltransferase [Phycisphaerales bacterium]|nr:3-deoxy-manno-octulosonate cytidylyltransferase [Phycisphaerales bacterium]
MSAIAVIPARFGSTRYPGKPLLRETGKFLIQHVYERTAAACEIAQVLVATDDDRIAAAVRSFGGEAVLTRPDHPSGTDRIAEVLAARPGPDDQVILNVQGDEPEVEPAYLDQLVRRLAAEPSESAGGCPIATLACPFPPDHDPRDPNCVKVVRNSRGQALYFSRSLIPYPRDGGGMPAPGPWLLHLGVYAYRRGFLLRLAAWEPGVLEQIEKLEQLRVLEKGVGLAVEVVPRATPGIDTPEDYARFVARVGVSD